MVRVFLLVVILGPDDSCLPFCREVRSLLTLDKGVLLDPCPTSNMAGLDITLLGVSADDLGWSRVTSDRPSLPEEGERIFPS